MTLTVREGEPVRFSLASLSPLPAGLLAHTRHVIGREFENVEERSPRVDGVHALTFLGHLRRSSGGVRGDDDVQIGAVSQDDVTDNSSDTSPRVPTQVGSAADLQAVVDELRGPALALGMSCAFITGEIAVDGPRLIVSDVDSTFIRDEVIEMIAAAADVEDHVREITERAMRGELDFAESLRERVACVEGVPTSMFADVAGRVTVTPGAGKLVDATHTRGGKFGLVSGGFHEVVDRFAAPFGVDGILANRFNTADGQLTGTVDGEIIDREVKARTLIEWAEQFDVPVELTAAMGDGANDLAMMDVAGLSVAFCAKPIVLATADAIVTQPSMEIVIALLGWDD
ncbi:MAG: phosphoserine phosphatase SerB [Ancrocorticia sp.]